MRLLQNQPNPFTGEMTIGFVLPAGGCQAQLRFAASASWQYETDRRFIREWVWQAFLDAKVAGDQQVALC